jgi:hypothetical protein
MTRLNRSHFPISDVAFLRGLPVNSMNNEIARRTAGKVSREFRRV